MATPGNTRKHKKTQWILPDLEKQHSLGGKSGGWVEDAKQNAAFPALMATEQQTHDCSGEKHTGQHM